MIQFILNDTDISTSVAPGTLLLDFIRYHKNLTGTKIGCREGDCGACTVLVGEISEGKLIYRSATSCLMAIGNAKGKHIVTVEGVNIFEVRGGSIESNPIDYQMLVIPDADAFVGFSDQAFDIK